MITIELYPNSNEKYTLDNMVESVSWGGDINTFPRNLKVNIKNTADYSRGQRLVNYDVGNLVVAKVGNEEIFRGFIFKTSIDSSGSGSFTAYDELIYMTKNSISILVKNKTASQVAKELFSKYGIKTGSIEETGFKIKKQVFQGQTISKVLEDMLEETKKSTKRSYTIYSKKGLAYLKGRVKATELTIDVADVISASKDTSIDELRTQVMVTKGSLDPKEGSKEAKFTSVVEKNNDSAKKYGIMQHIEEADDKDTLAQMRSKAKSMLATLSKPDITSSIEFVGDISCTTGNKIKINDTMTGIQGLFYITSDSHTFSGGVHKMTLQLSKTLE